MYTRGFTSKLSSLRVAVLALVLVSRTAFASTGSNTNFNPRHYTKNEASCIAINRAANGSAVELDLRYVDVNPSANTTMILVHGWPSLWSSWSRQIQEFKDDYRLLVPDQRGFGESTHPGDVESSGTMGDLVGDLVCILEHASVSSAICVGHDWGAQVCYEAAWMRPDIFTAVVGLTIPYIPPGDQFIPISQLVPAFPQLTYQLLFERQTGLAVAELDTDLRRTIRATLRTVDSPPPSDFLTSQDSFLGAWNSVSQIPPVPFFSQEEEDYFVEQYSIQGFKNTLQFYTHSNRHGSWKFGRDQGNYTISQPSLSILPLNDPVANWVLAARLLRSEDFLPHLTTATVDGAHWVHLENPNAVNTIMRRWLSQLSLDDEDPVERILDEL